MLLFDKASIFINTCTCGHGNPQKEVAYIIYKCSFTKAEYLFYVV